MANILGIAYCFIKHIILGKQYIHSFSKCFLSSFYVPSFSKTNISALMEVISMVSSGEGGEQHIINKKIYSMKLVL